METFFGLFISLCIGFATSLPLESAKEVDSTTLRNDFASYTSQVVATNLLKSFKDIDGNQVHSPLGVTSILAVLAEGAAGETYDEFNKVFGYPKERTNLRDSFRRLFAKYQNRQYSAEPSFQTWLYIYRNHSVRPEYKQILEDCYYVTVKEINRDVYDWSEPNTSIKLDDNKATTTTVSNSKDVIGFESLKRIEINNDGNAEEVTDTYGEEIVEKEASKFDRFVDDKQYVEKPEIIEEIKLEKETEKEKEAEKEKEKKEEKEKEAEKGKEKEAEKEKEKEQEKEKQKEKVAEKEKVVIEEKAIEKVNKNEELKELKADKEIQQEKLLSAEKEKLALVQQSIKKEEQKADKEKESLKLKKTVVLEEKLVKVNEESKEKKINTQIARKEEIKAEKVQENKPDKNVEQKSVAQKVEVAKEQQKKDQKEIKLEKKTERKAEITSEVKDEKKNVQNILKNEDSKKENKEKERISKVKSEIVEKLAVEKKEDQQTTTVENKQKLTKLVANPEPKEQNKRENELNVEENETVQDEEKLQKNYVAKTVDSVPVKTATKTNEPEKVSLPLQKLEGAIESGVGELMEALEMHLTSVRRVFGARSLFNKDDITAALSANSITGRELNTQTKMLLFNGLYYRGNWQRPFTAQPDGDEEFFMTNDDAIKTPMMHAKGKYHTAELAHLNAKALCIPYENKRYAMLLIVPNENEGLHAVIEKLQPSDFKYIEQNFQEKQLHLTIPKFQVEETSRSESMLKNLGLTKIFSSEFADLSLLAADPNLHVDEIVQFVNLRVDEGGSSESSLSATSATSLEEAAATLARTAQKDMELEMFRVNRPFLYFVMDCEERFIIASGKIFSPEFKDQRPISVEVEVELE